MAAFSIDVRSNVNLLADRLDGYRMQKLPFATVYALTATAKDIQAAQVQSMAAVFDRPTPYVLDSLRVIPATKQQPMATVTFKDSGAFGRMPGWKTLKAEIDSGPRAAKGFEEALRRAGVLKANEFCVPGQTMQLDAYGNMAGSQIERILADIGASETISGHTSNTTAAGRAKRRRHGSGQYFVMRGRSAPDGIYFRLGLRAVRPALLFVRQPMYAARLPFRQTAEQTFNRRFDPNFQVGMLRFGSPSVPRAA